LKVANLSPRLAQEIGMSTDKRGVVVLEVKRRSPASRIGFRAGDILLEVNEEEVSSTNQLDELSKAGGRGWEFALERNGRRYEEYVR
jgi:S1-C subfamily serine protease